MRNWEPRTDLCTGDGYLHRAEDARGDLYSSNGPEGHTIESQTPGILPLTQAVNAQSHRYHSLSASIAHAPRRVLYYAWVFILIFWLSQAPPLYAGAPSFGPFSVRDQFPVKQLFLSLSPEEASLAPEGTRQFSVRFAYTNTYAVTRPIGDPRVALDYYQSAPLSGYRLLVDVETLRLELGMNWRVTRWLQVGVTAPIIGQSGGFLDRTVEGFHRLFRLSNGGREEIPRNAYGVYVLRNGEFWIARTQAPGLRLGDMVLRVKTPLLSREAGPRLSMAGVIKIPTGRFEDLTGSEGTDIQLALLASQPIGRRWVIHYNIAFTKLGQPKRAIGFPLRSIRSQMLAFEFLATTRLSLLMQMLSNTSLFPKSGLAPLNRTAYEIDAGIKVAITPATVLEIGLIENLSQHQNTPDIGLHAGFSIRR